MAAETKLRPTTLEVKHHGVWKMIGKVYPDEDGQWLWLHEESGNQMFEKYHGPAMDTLGLLWCRDQGVGEYHHWTLGPKLLGVRPGLYKVDVVAVLDLGERIRYDGRDRYALDIDAFRGPYPPPERVPWLDLTTHIEPRDVDLASLMPAKNQFTAPVAEWRDLTIMRTQWAQGAFTMTPQERDELRLAMYRRFKVIHPNDTATRFARWLQGKKVD